MRASCDRYRGRLVKTTGDGVLATFDGPGRAIRCAHAIHAGGRNLSVEIRAGLHTGECELRGDDLAGLTVHIAARVASKTGAGDVLVTSIVRDLIVGSGIDCVEREHTALKGVPGEWTLFAAAAAQ